MRETDVGLNNIILSLHYQFLDLVELQNELDDYSDR